VAAEVTAYEVRLHGATSVLLVESLCAEVDMNADTVLYGNVADQAALHGLLARISDLGLEIVDVRQLSRWHDPNLEELGSHPPPD
jgi:hypothetical protein